MAALQRYFRLIVLLVLSLLPLPRPLGAVKSLDDAVDFTEILVSEAPPQTLDACMDLAKPPTPLGRAYFAVDSRDQDFNLVGEMRRYVTRCIRGQPYNEVREVGAASEARQRRRQGERARTGPRSEATHFLLHPYNSSNAETIKHICIL